MSPLKGLNKIQLFEYWSIFQNKSFWKKWHIDTLDWMYLIQNICVSSSINCYSINIKFCITVGCLEFYTPSRSIVLLHYMSPLKGVHKIQLFEYRSIFQNKSFWKKWQIDTPDWTCSIQNICVSSYINCYSINIKIFIIDIPNLFFLNLWIFKIDLS